jgi:hypothetical protein
MTTPHHTRPPGPVVYIPPPSQANHTSTGSQNEQPAANRPSQNNHLKPPAKFRAPTFDEALPLTPISSIVPFSHGRHLPSANGAPPQSSSACFASIWHTRLTWNTVMVPLPTADTSPTPSIFPNSESRVKARETLDELNAQSADPSTTLSLVQESLDRVRKYLAPGELTT